MLFRDCGEGLIQSEQHVSVAFVGDPDVLPASTSDIEGAGFFSEGRDLRPSRSREPEV